MPDPSTWVFGPRMGTWPRFGDGGRPFPADPGGDGDRAAFFAAPLTLGSLRRSMPRRIIARSRRAMGPSIHCSG